MIKSTKIMLLGKKSLNLRCHQCRDKVRFTSYETNRIERTEEDMRAQRGNFWEECRNKRVDEGGEREGTMKGEKSKDEIGGERVRFWKRG